MLIAECFSRVEAGLVLPDDLSPRSGAALLGALVERRPAGSRPQKPSVIPKCASVAMCPRS